MCTVVPFAMSYICIVNDKQDGCAADGGDERILTEPPVGKRKQYDAKGDEMKYGRMERNMWRMSSAVCDRSCQGGYSKRRKVPLRRGV